MKNLKQALFFVIICFLACAPKNETPKVKSETPQEKIVSENTQPEKLKPKKGIQNGDIIFHTSLSNQSMAIQIATKSKYSHVGVIYKEGEKFFVYEAIQPIKLTPINDWINRGEDGHYVIKRLKNSDEILNIESIAKMKSIGKKYLGKNYDLKFEWSDNKIYCSELVWKIYKEAFDIEIGTLEKIKDFDLTDRAVQVKLKERYGNNIPMEELVITPDRMFNSNKLETIVEK